MNSEPREAASFEPSVPAPDAPDPVPRAVQQAFVWGAGALLVVFLLVYAWLDARAGSPAERVKRLMPGIGADVVDVPLTAEQASFRLETETGATMTLAQLPKNRLIFLNFWATWCPPCREELPSMLRLQQQLRDRPFTMIGVSYDDDWSAVREFFSRARGGMPPRDQLLVLRDTSGDNTPKLRELFGTDKLPDSYVILNGRVVARFVNARNWVDPAIVEYFRQLTPGGAGADAQ